MKENETLDEKKKQNNDTIKKSIVCEVKSEKERNWLV